MIDLLHLSPEGTSVQGRTERIHLDGLDQLRDLEWRLQVLPSDKDVFISVSGDAVWEGACSRCLEPIERPFHVDSQFLGSNDSALVARGAHTLGTQDLDVVFLPEPMLDEAAFVAEQFQLQVPMHPLCRDTCEGLCPRCGKNWNKGRCQCRPEQLKEPSALAKALSGLKLDLEP